MDYPFDIENEQSIREGTEALINYWDQRWLHSRINSVDIVGRLQGFDANEILVSTTR